MLNDIELVILCAHNTAVEFNWLEEKMSSEKSASKIQIYQSMMNRALNSLIEYSEKAQAIDPALFVQRTGLDEATLNSYQMRALLLCEPMYVAH